MRTQAICLTLAIILQCSHGSAQWMKTSLPDNISASCFAQSGMNLFAGTSGGVFLSTNSGASWTPASTGLTNTNVVSLAISGTNLFAGTSGRVRIHEEVFLSTNNGASWTAASTPFHRFGSMAQIDSNLFAGTGNGVFLSTNRGIDWTPVKSGLTDSSVHALVVSTRGKLLFAGTGNGVFLSGNNGTSWTERNNGLQRTVSALGVSGTNLFAGTSSGVYLSTSNGTSWTAENYGMPRSPHYPWPYPEIRCFASYGTQLFAGTSSGVFVSIYNGTGWSPVNTGLADTVIQTLTVSGAYLFAGTSGNGLWRRPVSEMVVSSVEPATRELPDVFSLSQNYPNPFNPSTTIRFELPEESHVNLTAYDMLGRMVSVLVDDRRDAGVHEVKFDGSRLASGVYVYRIQAGHFVQAKTLVMVK